MASREYHKEYNIRRYHKRMQQMRDVLGGKCVICGTSDGLQIDHTDPETMSFRLSIEWDKPWEQIIQELDKCQLLCQPCHNNKTLADNGKVPARGTHGTLSSYRYCKCTICREARNNYIREYRKTHTRKK